ncbi:MAG: Uma2 family endonuclease [Cyanobacteriota bacterium]
MKDERPVTSVIKHQFTLEEFLKLPETKPASEFINGEIIHKPMPQGEHSRLQAKLCTVINQVTEAPKIAYAFPQLRCTFGGDSIIPDVAVFRWERIPTPHTPLSERNDPPHPTLAKQDVLWDGVSWARYDDPSVYYSTEVFFSGSIHTTH